MGVKVSAKSSGNFEVTPSGTWKARCYSIVDLGTQEVRWQDEVNHKRQVRLSWELIDAPRMSDGRPFSIHKTYTLSLHEKATLRHHLESWRNKPFTEEELAEFDLDKVLGAPCLIGVNHREGKNGNTYANIQAILAAPAKEVGPMENAPVSFSIVEPDMDLFNSFSEWLQKKINESDEFQMRAMDAIDPPHVTDEQIATSGTSADDFDDDEDDIPF